MLSGSPVWFVRPAVRLWLLLAALLLAGAIWQAGTLFPQAQMSPSSPTPTLAPGRGGMAGLAWHDTDGNGVRDATELPLPGLTVALTTDAGQPIRTAQTASDGTYRITDLVPGFYIFTATPPPGYQMTTLANARIYIAADQMLTLDFGARFIPSPTPTATPLPVLDISNAEFAVCGGLIFDDTARGQNRVSRYGCRPAWDESGPELVYRLELGRSQPITAALLSATADLDLFLLPSIYPETCLAAGDVYLTAVVNPGIYFLVVDGYMGAQGAFTLRLECPYGPQATATPTRTPSPTPTVTRTATPGPTRTPTPTPRPRLLYLPLIVRSFPGPLPDLATLVFQQGVDGYTGTSDTTLSLWEPGRNFGADTRLRLRYTRSGDGSTEMASLLRFDLAPLPGEAFIMEAQLELYLEAIPKYDIRAEAHGLLRAWREDAATWGQAAPGQPWTVGGAGGVGTDHLAEVADLVQIQPVEQWYRFNITNLVRRWVHDPASNFGLVLLARPGDSNANVEAGFASREHDQPMLRPRLTITYYLPTGLGAGEIR